MMAKEMMESFTLTENMDPDTEQEEDNPSTDSSILSRQKPNLGVTISASRFAASTRRGIQKIIRKIFGVQVVE
ncbi:hypothetical protein RJ641_027768 [Dillenia turbinata]|uniref:Uncharacterized protein n=1 Tax=Dillenia turbinata TaxID=194707 RepID=A0AAN8ZLL8_9MAGN